MKIKRVQMVLCFSLSVVINLADAQSHRPTPGPKCFKIGDTVSIRGRITPNVNGGTYFELWDHLCVYFPKPTDRFSPSDLTTVGDKLPATGYLEVKGELVDLYSLGLYGVGIKSTDVRDVDAEVKAEIEESRLSCEKWQEANSDALGKRTHGGRIIREPQNMRGTDYVRGCSIWSVDSQLPHEMTTLRRTTREP